jgi:hypothetical protein
MSFSVLVIICSMPPILVRLEQPIIKKELRARRMALEYKRFIVSWG